MKSSELHNLKVICGIVFFAAAVFFQFKFFSLINLIIIFIIFISCGAKRLATEITFTWLLLVSCMRVLRRYYIIIITLFSAQQLQQQFNSQLCGLSRKFWISWHAALAFSLSNSRKKKSHKPCNCLPTYTMKLYLLIPSLDVELFSSSTSMLVWSITSFAAVFPSLSLFFHMLCFFVLLWRISNAIFYTSRCMWE
jgi:hypothetical protein